MSWHFAADGAVVAPVALPQDRGERKGEMTPAAEVLSSTRVANFRK